MLEGTESKMNHGIKYFIINSLMMIDVARKDQSRDLISAVEGVRSLWLT